MNTTIELTPAMLGLVPVVAYFLQMFKGLPTPISSKLDPFMPIVSMLVGIGLSYLMSIDNPVLAGILIGMASSTGYDQFKKTAKMISGNTNNSQL